MDAVLQNFRRSFGPTTPFFQFLSLDPLATMKELYRRVDKYSTLEDNIQAASQTVMITARAAKLPQKASPNRKEARAKVKSVPKNSQKRKRNLPTSPPSTSPMTSCCPSSGTTPILNGPRPCGQIQTNTIGL